MRRKLSLLLANGHPSAHSYPLGFMSDEAKLVVERRNGEIANLGVVMQAAGASIMSKKGGDLFKSIIRRMTEE